MMSNQDLRCKKILEEMITLAEELENQCDENNTYWFANDTRIEAKNILEECNANERF